MHLVQMQPIYDDLGLGQLGLFRAGVCVPEELPSCAPSCASSPGDVNERGSPFFCPLSKLPSGFLATTTKRPPLSFLSPQCREAGALAVLENQEQNADDTGIKITADRGGESESIRWPAGQQSHCIPAQQVSLSRGRWRPGLGGPAAGHSAPMGRCGVAATRCAGLRELAELARPGRPNWPRPGGPAAPPSLSPSAPRGREPGAQGGRGRPTGGAARGRTGRGAGLWARPRAWVPKLCLSVCLSAPRGCGARQGPGESAPRSPAATAGAWEARQVPGLRRWPPRRSESHGSPRESLVGAEEEAEVLPLSPLSPLPPSPIPERSARSLAAWAALGQRRQAAGEAAPRRVGRGPAGGGVYCLGMGQERRGIGREDRPTLQAAPGAGHPGRTPCLLPPRSARSVPKPRRGSDPGGLEPHAGSEKQGALGSWRRGVGWGAEESISWREKGMTGVLFPELGVMIYRRRPSMTVMKKKVLRTGLTGDKCQELSWQYPEHRCQFILTERPLARNQAPGWGRD